MGEPAATLIDRRWLGAARTWAATGDLCRLFIVSLGRLVLTRKLAHLIYGVVKSGKPFDANFAMNGVAIQDGI